MLQEEKTKISRELILSEAIKEFGTNQYSSASINSICKNGGISKGKLYHHFTNKDELFIAAVKKVGDEIIEAEREAQRDFSVSVEENLMQIIKKRAEYLFRHPAAAPLFWGAMQSPPEALRSELSACVEKATGSALDIIRSAFACTEIKNDDDLDICASAVQMAFNHGAFRAIKKWSLDDDEKNRKTLADNTEYIKSYIQIVLYGALKGR